MVQLAYLGGKLTVFPSLGHYIKLIKEKKPSKGVHLAYLGGKLTMFCFSGTILVYLGKSSQIRQYRVCIVRVS